MEELISPKATSSHSSSFVVSSNNGKKKGVALEEEKLMKKARFGKMDMFLNQVPFYLSLPNSIELFSRLAFSGRWCKE